MPCDTLYSERGGMEDGESDSSYDDGNSDDSDGYGDYTEDNSDYQGDDSEGY